MSELNEMDELRALVREVIRDVLPEGLPGTEMVDLSTDDDLADFVTRLLDLDDEEREELRTGRKRFRLGAAAAAPPPAASRAAASPQASGTRRIDSGAVTEAVIRDAARAGQRLVLGRGAVLTPLARDRARASGVQIEKER